MMREKINEATGKLRAYLWHMSVPSERAPDNTLVYDRDTQLKHCMWMCNAVLEGIGDARLSDDKAMRWLCFVQGVLWGRPLKTINEFKEMNRADNHTSDRASDVRSGCERDQDRCKSPDPGGVGPVTG